MEERTKEKLRYLLAKHPEVRELFESGENRLGEVPDVRKHVCVSESETAWKWCLLKMLVQNPKLRVRELDVMYILDTFLGNTGESISSLREDIIVIHDGRLKMNHSQKDILLAEIWENNERVIYDYRGSINDFQTKSQLDSSLFKEVFRDDKHNSVSNGVRGPVDTDLL